MQIAVLGLRSVTLMPEDDGIALLDHLDHEVHRHEGLAQACKLHGAHPRKALCTRSLLSIAPTLLCEKLLT